MNKYERFFDNLNKDVQTAHRNINGAGGPPSNMWNAIQAKAKRETTQEEKTMIASTTLIAAPGSFRGYSHKGFRHFANLIAIIGIVVAVALAGWFATMQLHQPGDPEPRLAILSATPGPYATPASETAMCDVEPLTVDQVMEVVKNPFLYMDNGPAGEPVEPEISTSPYRTDLYQAWPIEQIVRLDGGSHPLTDQQFEAAGEVAQGFLNCLAFGTLGQAWVFLSPIHIQQDVLWEFPVFANEVDVRDRVEERLSQPALDNVDRLIMTGAFSNFSPADVMINPDPDLALSRRFSLGAYDNAITFGARFLDESGNEIYLSAGNGRDLVGAPSQGSFYLTVTVAYSAIYDSWFVVPYIQV